MSSPAAFSHRDMLIELARGIHPAVLTQRGLEPALQSLASRAPLPVDVCAPLSEAVETAAYFAVSEALANVVKHAGAGTRVHVEIPLSRPTASPPLRSRPVISGPCRRFLRGG
jgi:hypothetical protein